MARKFFEMLEKRWAAGARVCVGLDSDFKKVPTAVGVVNFNKAIIKATKDLVLAYKPNIAFYSDKGGLRDLSDTMDILHNEAPEVPVILDAKRADIGNTNRGYVEEAFKNYEVDAVTVNPYFGMEAMKPFLDQKDKGTIVLCRTSNKGAEELQDLIVFVPKEAQKKWGESTKRRMPLYEYVAHRVAREWNENGNCALVVGATVPEQLKIVREVVGDMWLLLPGIGAQGGDLQKSVQNGVNSRKRGVIINSSSGVIFAGSGANFAETARLETQRLTFSINQTLEQL